MEYARGVALFEHILCVRTYSEKDARDLIKTLLQVSTFIFSFYFIFFLVLIC
jgi:hypothetical protein